MPKRLQGKAKEMLRDAMYAPTREDAEAAMDGFWTMTFDFVAEGGMTSLEITSTGPLPPSGFQLGSPPTYFDLSTTATFAGSVEICIDYSGLSFGQEENLKLFHFENGVWIDRTFSLDTENDVICAVGRLGPVCILRDGAGHRVSGLARRSESED